MYTQFTKITYSSTTTALRSSVGRALLQDRPPEEHYSETLLAIFTTYIAVSFLVCTALFVDKLCTVPGASGIGFKHS